ncbi:MAG: hypothetical protein NC177_18125 [Ruminococcus flavefaciens]|nr:hypothetical protein [Ruminococcus flavefaciens]
MKSCENCYHYDACCEFVEVDSELHPDITNWAEGGCKCFKDKAQIIELPCKVGDTVYYLDTAAKEDKCRKCQFYYNGEVGCVPTCNAGGIVSYECVDITRYKVTFRDIRRWTLTNSFGNSVYITREEAEQELKKLKNRSENSDA